jgi:hypothetical protein
MTDSFRGGTGLPAGVIDEDAAAPEKLSATAAVIGRPPFAR